MDFRIRHFPRDFEGAGLLRGDKFILRLECTNSHDYGKCEI